MRRSKADPSPCERCEHRRDMHEMLNGLLMCRACNYIALRFPCSPKTLEDEAKLAGLKFDFDPRYEL